MEGRIHAGGEAIECPIRVSIRPKMPLNQHIPFELEDDLFAKSIFESMGYIDSYRWLVVGSQ